MLRERWDALIRVLEKHGRVLVAFSGGCDSAFLLAAARQALGEENVLAVTAVSPSLARRDVETTDRIVRLLNVRHRFLQTDELENESYRANPSNRCFYCKDELFSKLVPIARANTMVIADGYNASDRSDLRPGQAAARAWNVIHPLDEADLDKRSIRILSRWMKLPTWNKPSSPCLSSRIPYGTPVTEAALHRIEKAEEVVRSEGFRIVRVRHYGRQARIEVPLEDLPRLLARDGWKRIVLRLRALGYEEINADSRGFESGRLNRSPAPARG